MLKSKNSNMKKLQDIRINVAYDNILTTRGDGTVSFIAPNVLELPIHPWHTLTLDKIKEVEKNYNIKFPISEDSEIFQNTKISEELVGSNSHKIEEFIDNTYNTFLPVSTEVALKSTIPFIYPIMLYDVDIFRYEPIDLPVNVIEAVRMGRGKVVFMMATEGFFGISESHFIWFSDLAEKYSLGKNDLFIITSNLNAQNLHEELVESEHIVDNFTTYSYNYFQHKIWFQHGGDVLNEETKRVAIGAFENCLEKKQTGVFEFRFLCFNRVTKPHRVVTFGQLVSDQVLREQSILSCGTSASHFAGPGNFEGGASTLEENYKYGREKILKYFREVHDETKPYVYDFVDLNNNKAGIINLKAQTISFINIVTESLVEPTTVFCSEKIFKPIYSAQPFLLVGNPYTLKHLRERGFQTFSRWWDESYDEEENFTRRFEKIMDVVYEVSSWSPERCTEVYNEMESVLRNNINVMVDSYYPELLIKELSNYA